MNSSDKLIFNFQYLLGHIFILITAPVIFFFIVLSGYRVNNFIEIRKKTRTMFKKHKGPWLICANHLTMIDSLIIAYIIFPFHHYLLHYKSLPWNLPEKSNMYKIHPVILWLCFILKCIPVERRGSRKSLNLSLEKCTYILGKGENLVIFPEGKRSRAGRIDTKNFPYSVGRFLQNTKNCRVLCIYLRGEKQNSFSNLPQKNEIFYAAVDDFIPVNYFRGLKAQRDLARQIIVRLSKMENRYFDSFR